MSDCFLYLYDWSARQYLWLMKLYLSNKNSIHWTFYMRLNGLDRWSGEVYNVHDVLKAVWITSGRVLTVKESINITFLDSKFHISAQEDYMQLDLSSAINFKRNNIQIYLEDCKIFKYVDPRSQDICCLFNNQPCKWQKFTKSCCPIVLSLKLCILSLPICCWAVEICISRLHCHFKLVSPWGMSIPNFSSFSRG